MKHSLFLSLLLFSIITFSCAQEKNNVLEDFPRKLNEIPIDYKCIDNSIDIFYTLTRNVEENTADSLFSVLFNYILLQEGNLTDQLNKEKDISDYNSLAMSDPNKHTPKAVEFAIQLKKDNLAISSEEGMLFLIYNLGNNKEKISTRLSANGIKLLNLIILEREQPASEDAALNISQKEVAERLALWDMQLTYKIPLKELKQNMYDTYLYFLIYGIDNTPLTKDGEKIDPDYIKAYEYLMSQYPKNKSTLIISKYYELLKDNNFQISDEIRNFAFD